MDARQGRQSAGNAPVAFVDSSAIVALVDRDDATHEAAVEAYRSLLASGDKLFTTNAVVVETYDLLATSVGHEVARRWLRDMRLPIYHITEEDAEKARKLLSRPDAKAVSLTNALSFVVMERLGVTDAFAVDQSFLTEMG